MPEEKSTPGALGRAIRQRRQALGLTQENLCERMGLPLERITYISAVENGVRADMRLSRLELFARALDTSAGNLLLVTSQEVCA